jgi:pimeloyl-ACP methyl ester carboxylesterase
MPYIATDDGVRIHYETFGEAGEPLVLVHGFTGDIGDWDEQVAAFSGRTGCSRWITGGTGRRRRRRGWRRTRSSGWRWTSRR